MAKSDRSNKKRKKPPQKRSPVPPPTIRFKDRRKEAKRRACRDDAALEDE